ncbi:MAG: hypothetical protein AUK34_02605 [Ignavibacteria bacterium CG2_30_36_16]|nr:MAG: hypothetical protein AUK34_02605 [Ignavibacteria bacterium CG2_30_36_16]
MKTIMFFVILFSGLSFNSYAQVFFNYTANSGYGYYDEISGGTISSAAGDGGSEIVTLPFPFHFADSVFNKAKISTNGWVQLGAAYSGAGNINDLADPAYKNFIAPLWDDLYADAQSEIRYKTVGAYPARYFVVQWKNIRWESNFITNRKSFQVIFSEFDGSMIFSYGSSSGNSDISCSIGIVNQAGGLNNFISVSLSSPLPYFISLSNTVSDNNISPLSLLPENSQIIFFPIDNYRPVKLYQVPDTLFAGTPNQKIIGILHCTHPGPVLTPPWMTKLKFNTFGTSDTSNILRAKLYSTGYNPQFSTQQQIGATVENPGNEFEIGNLSHIYYGVDKAVYFWLVFDIAPTAHLGNMIDATCTLIESQGCCPSVIPDTTLAAGYHVIGNGGVSGTFKIGSNENFNKINDALNFLNSSILTGPVNIEITDSYNPAAEVFPIVIPYIQNTNDSNKVTIYPAANVSQLILSSDKPSTVIFNNSSNIVFDGRAGGTGTTKTLTIKNTSPVGNAVSFNDATNVTIQYCNLTAVCNQKEKGIILFDNSDYFQNSNILISECSISGNEQTPPFIGVNFLPGSYNSQSEIKNCAVNNFLKTGIFIGSDYNSKITGCSIYNSPSIVIDTVIGIYCNDYSPTISGNKIFNINGTEKVTGIYIPNSSSQKIFNNFITLGNNTDTEIEGINFNGEYASNILIYNNTILIYGNYSGLKLSAGILRQNQTYNAGFSFKIKNNIVINRRTTSSANWVNLAIDIEDDRRNPELDYNNYYSSPGTFFGKWKTNYAFYINDWQIYTGQEQNSTSKDVNFISNSDLHLTGASLGDVDLTGTPIPIVQTDIDGEPRNQIHPYMGADESLDFPLPVELVSFSAESNVDDVLLSWTTASEINNKGFEVERSIKNHPLANGLKIKNFEPIGFVNGKGTSTELNHYSFKDETVSAGKYIYRLKQIDYDGSFEYSNEIEVEIGVPDEFVLYQNYPNPFNPTTNIQYAIASTQHVQLKIYDVLGNEVAVLVDEEKSPGNYSVEFESKNVASGLYFYSLTAGSLKQTKKMLLIK